LVFLPGHTKARQGRPGGHREKPIDLRAKFFLTRSTPALAHRIVGYPPRLGEELSACHRGPCITLVGELGPNDTTISKDELAPYMADADFTVLDPDNDGTIDANEFMAGCKGGLIKIVH
jgi:hypothetical protein